MEWSNEKVLSLIELYRRRPILWNCKLEEYKDRNKRYDAFVEIAESFEIEKEEIERKLKNLICHFSREIKKEKDSVKSGSGIEEVYKSKWFAYQSMEFLKDRNRPKKMTDTQDTMGRMATESDEIIQKVIDNENEKSIQLLLTSKRKKRPLSSSRYTNKCKHTVTDETLAIMNDIQAGKSVRDQYALFGKQVGMQIRNLPSTHTRQIVRKIISTVLFEAEMGQYDYPPTISLQSHSGTHLYSKPSNSRVPMYVHPSTPIPGHSTFHQPFPNPNQIPTPNSTYQRSIVSPVSFTDDPETTDSDSIDNILMEL